jgi:hypothetical protein
MRALFALCLSLLLCLAALPMLMDPSALAAAAPALSDLAVAGAAAQPYLIPPTLIAVGGVAVPKGTFATIAQKIKSALNLGDDVDIDAVVAATFEETDAVPAPKLSVDPNPDRVDPQATGAAAQMETLLAPMRAQIETLTKALETSSARAEGAEKAIQEQQAKQRAAKIDADLTAAVKDGRVTPEKRDSWKTRLETDYDGMSTVLAELPANPALGSKKSTTETGGATVKPARPSSVRPDVAAYLAGESAPVQAAA